MKLTSYAESTFHISQAKDAGLYEILLGHKELNRFSKTNTERLEECLAFAKSLGMKTILEWDILCTEGDFSQMVGIFEKIKKENIDSIRVQDSGVLEYVLEQTAFPVQFISETGNHNISGLLKWEEYIGGRLERIILSSEINQEKLKEIKQALKTQLEILGLGRVLLFYTPRKLLNHLLPETDELKQRAVHSDDFIEALGESEESPHKGFPIIENRHGTFMFHIKDLFLLDRKTDLISIGMDYLRIDLRFEEDNSLLTTIKKQFIDDDKPEQIKSVYGPDGIRGYFQVNKSDVIFKKLKNYRIQRKDDLYIGEIVEICKSDYMAIELRTDKVLKVDEMITLITPEGKKVETKIFFIKNSSYNEDNNLAKGDLALINYVGGIWPKSQVYFRS
jgi:putative protease